MRSCGVLVLVLAFGLPLWSEPPAPAPATVPAVAADSDPVPTPDTPAPILTAPSRPLSVPSGTKGSEVSELLSQGKLAEAEKVAEAQVAAAPRDPDWLTLLAEVRVTQGREGEAVQLFREADQIAGPTPLREMLIGMAECIWNRTDLAEPEFREAIRMDPFNPTPHYFLARLLYNDKRFDEAIQESKNAVSLRPDFVRAYENLGLCYEGTRDLDSAEKSYKEAIAKEAGFPTKSEWPALDLGRMLVDQNRLEDAKPYLEQAVAINPKNPKALQQLGVLKSRMGDKAGALQAFQSAIQQDPKMETAYYQAARTAREMGNVELATQYFDQFRKIHEGAARIIITPVHPAAPAKTP